MQDFRSIKNFGTETIGTAGMTSAMESYWNFDLKCSKNLSPLFTQTFTYFKLILKIQLFGNKINKTARIRAKP